MPFKKARDFHSLFKALKIKMNQNKDDLNFSLPHKQRLCIVADRRKGPKRNEIFMYKPTKSGDMPSQKVSEWGFQSAFDSLIPSKHARTNISAKTSAKGY